MSEELKAILKAALDYVEGWYEADTVRMERALHPELAKRVVQKIDGEDHLRTTSFERMLELVKSRSKDKGALDNIRCEVLDVYGGIATVKTTSPDFIDYLHLAKWRGEWKIMNALWEFTPEGRRRIEAAQKQSKIQN